MKGTWRRKVGVARSFVALAVFTAGCAGDGLEPEELARAGDFRLGIEEAVAMVAPVAALPADEIVLRAVADFWADYVLLAWAVNSDGELQKLDLTHVLAAEVSNETVDRLRNAVIQVREIPDDELREMFEQNRPGLAVRARHVLLRFPEAATAAQRDSVRRLAEEIRDQARAGVDFAALAQRYSSDSGSAAVGGDLGFFQRGEMVLPFEDAAFALRPGQVSDVVQTDFGLHVIRLEERREPTFEEAAEEYRAQLVSEGVAQAETLYVQGIQGPANIRVEEGAVALAREIAASMDEGMGGRAARRPLARFEGGEYTAGQFRSFLLGQPIELREQIVLAEDEQVDGLLRDLVVDQLLLADARTRGIAVQPAEIVAYEGELRQQYRQAAELLGLYPIQPAAGESLADAVDRQVKETMAVLVRGERNLVPLGGLANPFRDLYPVVVSRDAISRAAARVDTVRRLGGTTPAGPVTTPQPADSAPASRP